MRCIITRRTTRSRACRDLTVFAIDHRSQFEDLAAEAGTDGERISRFKMLGLHALDFVAQDDARFGVLLDGRYGFKALAQAAKEAEITK